MALLNKIHQIWKQLYEEAENSPDKQSSARVNFKNKEYKVRVQLANPDWRAGTILITMEPRK